MKYITFLFIALWTISIQAQTKKQEKQGKDTLSVATRAMSLSFEDSYTAAAPQVIPPSPQAAIFNKYLNHEVSDYNGLPKIEIPLHEIEIKGLKIPITLSYHAGGIKYLQYDGDIGAGWSINAGGYGITRTVYGRDDSSQPFFKEQEFNRLTSYNPGGETATIGYYASIGVENFSSFLQACLGYLSLQDGEYDHFNYMTPGGSGQFIIADRDQANTRKIVNTNPENRIVLSGSSQLSLSDMMVVDGNGFSYYMGKHPTQNNVYEEGTFLQYDKRTGWPLRQIKSPYNETIEFSYVAHNVSHDREGIYWDDYYTFNISEPPNDEGSDETFEASYNFNDTFYNTYGAPYKTYFVSEIRTDKEIVEFVRYAPQPETPYVIKEIRVKTLSGSIIKTIRFQYSTNELHRLLTKITVNDQVYNFDYYPSPDPSGSANRLYSDVWGYYKISEQTSSWLNYLDERYKDDEILYRYHRLYSSRTIVRKLKDIPEWQNMIVWVNRESNGETTHAFSLKKITFPTGGTTEYAYEPNQYKDWYQPSHPIISGAGQRIRKIISRADNGAKPITIVFRYGEHEQGYNEYNYFNFGNVINNYRSKTTGCLAYSISAGGASFFTYRRTQVHRAYSSRRPLQGDVGSNPPIIYAQVAKYQYDESGSLLNENGKTVSYYNPFKEINFAPAEGYFEGLTYGYVSHYYLGKRAMPDSICVFNKNNQPIQKEVYAYAAGEGYAEAYNGVRVNQWANIQDQSAQLIFLQNFGTGVTAFDHSWNKVSIGHRLLGSKTTTLYHGGSPVTHTETYAYNNRNQLVKTIQTNSLSGTVVKENKYADSYQGSVYSEMMSKNIIHPVIEQITANNNLEVGRIKTNYIKDPARTQGFILPDKVETSASGASALQTDITYDLYDEKGNPRQFTAQDEVKTVFLWSHNGRYPIAEIRNATYSEVQAAANAIGLNLSALLTTNTPDMNNVNALRNRLGNAHVTTFTYKPLVGVTSVTDPSGKVTHYEYDTCNRLKEVYILNGNVKEVVTVHKYNYINQ